MNSETCERVQGRLDELLDGALAPLERARDEGHLEACASCGVARAERAGRLAEVRVALTPGDAEWARARDGLEARLRAAASPRRAARLRLLRAAAVAATALIALSVLEELAGIDVAGELTGARRAVSTAVPSPSWPFDLGEMVEGE